MKLTKRIYLAVTAVIISVPLLVWGIVSAVGTTDDDPVGRQTPAGETEEALSAYNYYTSVYRGLDDSDNVFRSLLWNGLNQLLNTDGATYIILFGGAWDDATQEVIPYINEYAKKYGATDIYVFDFKLDGGAGEALGVNADISSPGHEFNRQYVEILSRLTNYAAVSGNTDAFEAVLPFEVPAESGSYVTENGDPRTSGTIIDLTPVPVLKIKTPTLLAYGKSLAGGPVLAVEDSIYAKGALQNEAAKNAYTAKLDAFFKKAAAGLRGNGSGKIKTDTFDYYSAEKMHLRGDDTAGIPYLPAEHIFQPVTYHELLDLFETQENFPLLFGGEWCPNTQAVLKYVNELGKYYGVEKIYMFDFRLDGVSAQPASAYHTTGAVTDAGKVVKAGRYIGHSNIRGNFSDDGVISTDETAYGRLYVKLLSYLKGFTSQWNDKAFGESVKETVTIDGAAYTRICSPALLLYDKAQGTTYSFEAEYRWGDHAENPGEAGTGDETSLAYRYVKINLTLLFEQYIELYNPDFVPGGAKAQTTDKKDTAPADDKTDPADGGTDPAPTTTPDNPPPEDDC